MLVAQTARVDQAEQGTSGKLSVYEHGDAAQKNGALLECFDSRCQNCTTGGIKTMPHSSKTLRIHLLPCSHGICAECLTYQETILPKVHLLGNFVCYGCGLRYKLSDYMDIQPTKLVMSLDHSFDTEELQPIFQDEFQQHLKSGENSLDWFEDRSPKMSKIRFM